VRIINAEEAKPTVSVFPTCEPDRVTAEALKRRNNEFSLRDLSLQRKPIRFNVSEFLQLIEITAFLMEHVSCRPNGIMEWWNIGMLV